MRIWTIKNVDRIKGHMDRFISETFINRMGEDPISIDPSLLIFTDVQNIYTKTRTGNRNLHFAGDIRSTWTYEIAFTTVS